MQSVCSFIAIFSWRFPALVLHFASSCSCTSTKWANSKHHKDISNSDHSFHSTGELKLFRIISQSMFEICDHNDRVATTTPTPRPDWAPGLWAARKSSGLASTGHIRRWYLGLERMGRLTQLVETQSWDSRYQDPHLRSIQWPVSLWYQPVNLGSYRAVIWGDYVIMRRGRLETDL